MKKHVFTLFLLFSALTLSAQFQLPAPSSAEALQKLKSSDALSERLKESNLTLAQVTIKLAEQEVIFFDSDEPCYQIYRDSKKIEGSNYVFTYEISSKPNAAGETQSTRGYVYYTRVDITTTTCNILNAWKYELTTVDAMSLNTKNGLLTPQQAETMIMDTISKGYALDAYYASNRDLSDINTRIIQTCRIDNFTTCEFGKSGCTDYYQVKNEMWEQTHIISFLTTVYRAEYETGACLWGSMYRVDKHTEVFYAEFHRVNGQLRIKTLSNSSVNREAELAPNSDPNRPLDTYYVPLSKTTVQSLRNTFVKGNPAPASILYFANSFSNMANDLNTKLNKDTQNNQKVFAQYLTPQSAEATAANYLRKTEDGKVYSNWELVKGNEFYIEIKCQRSNKKGKKGEYEEMTTRISFSDVVLIDGRYYLKDELSL